MVRQAIMGTYVLYEHAFSCQDMSDNQVVERVRVDKWLWAARFAKTRSAATELVLGGHVRVGGERVKPAREVTPGDTVEIRTGSIRRVVVVTGLADRRGPAKVAATLYEETASSREERERLALERRLARPLGADLGARPTKQERRRLDALRRGQRRR
jgi:ribosome-associated heat shock protein Hsp15